MKKISLQNRVHYNLIRYFEHCTPWKLDHKKIDEKILNDIKKTGKGELREVCSVENMTLEVFKKEFLAKGKPVVMKGFAKDWNCVKNWDLDYLENNFGTDKITLIDEHQEEGNYKIEETNLAAVLQAMKVGDKSKYSRFNRLLYDHPELLDDFDTKWMIKARNPLASGKTFQVFLGAGDTTTQLHAACEHNLFTQVYGKKHWYLIAPKFDPILKPLNLRAPYFHTDFNPAEPDYEKFPAMEYVDVYQCTLEAGDILFNPPSYWHHIYNPTASIGVGFRWFEFFDCLKLNFSQTLLTLGAVNPSIFTATKHRTNFVEIFKKLQEKK